MRIKTGTFVGNGDKQFVNLGFRPDLIFAKSSSSIRAGGYWQKHMWCGRSNHLVGLDSYKQGVQPEDDGFWVGNAPQFNGLAQTIYYLAIADDGEGALDLLSWFGNATAGRVINTNFNKQIKAAIVKRDSGKPGVFKSSLGTLSTKMDSLSLTSSTGLISSLGVGSMTLGAEFEVNEHDGGGNGEGINGAIFYGGANSAVITWTGNGAVGRSLALPFAAKAVFVMAQSGSGSPRLKTDMMAGDLSAPMREIGLQPTEGALFGSALIVGASIGAFNQTGEIFHAIVFGQDAAPAVATPIISKGRKVVSLPGRGVASYIDCGVSDATLKINGAMTVEWMGTLKYTAQGIVLPAPDAPLIMRSNGPAGTYETAGNVSWGLTTGAPDGVALAWSGPIFQGVVGQYLDLVTTTGVRFAWRTGVLVPDKDGLFHVMTIYDGTGGWKLLLNGLLVKERQFNMTDFGLQNIVSGAGHRTVIGARYDGTAFVRPARMNFALARVYNRSLTLAEAVARYQRAALGSVVADVTSGLAEEWDASNARGQTLPATVNAANNGTIVGGSVVSL